MVRTRIVLVSGEVMTLEQSFERREKTQRGDPPWWEVTAFPCADCPSCDGFEVCLIHKSPHGSSPTWPVLSCASEEEVLDWQGRLAVFAATLSPENVQVHRVDWEQPRARWDGRITSWLASQWWEPFNHITWKRGALEALAFECRDV